MGCLESARLQQRPPPQRDVEQRAVLRVAPRRELRLGQRLRLGAHCARIGQPEPRARLHAHAHWALRKKFSIPRPTSTLDGAMLLFYSCVDL